MGAKSPASRLFTQPFIRAQIKENIKAPRHWPPGTGEFPAQIASNAENVSIWWRHLEFCQKWSHQVIGRSETCGTAPARGMIAGDDGPLRNCLKPEHSMSWSSRSIHSFTRHIFICGINTTLMCRAPNFQANSSKVKVTRVVRIFCGRGLGWVGSPLNNFYMF